MPANKGNRKCKDKEDGKGKTKENKHKSPETEWHGVGFVLKGVGQFQRNL